ncbi:MAG: hypothetical protein R2684_02975 [Pyrinomonadaceae bacterium]
MFRRILKLMLIVAVFSAYFAGAFFKMHWGLRVSAESEFSGYTEWNKITSEPKELTGIFAGGG